MRQPTTISRRSFVLTGAAGAGTLLLPQRLLAAEAPAGNPAAALDVAWTDDLKWGTVVDVTAMAGDGKYWDKRLADAQAILDRLKSTGRLRTGKCSIISAFNAGLQFTSFRAMGELASSLQISLPVKSGQRIHGKQRI
jgi:hypothetical protein